MKRAVDVDEMRKCLASGDHVRVGQIAHRIAGTAALFGLPELGDIAKQVEVAPPAAVTTAGLIERLGRTVDDARRALAAKLE